MSWNLKEEMQLGNKKLYVVEYKVVLKIIWYLVICMILLNYVIRRNDFLLLLFLIKQLRN